MGLSLAPSAGASASSDALDHLFAGLNSEDEVVRRQYVDEIEKHVRTLIREQPPDDVQKIWEVDISRRLAKLVSGQSLAEKLGGLDAIFRLTSVVQDEGLDPQRNLHRLYNCVKTVLPSSEFKVMDAAAATSGNIIQVGGPFFEKTFMDFEVPGSLQLLSTNNGEGRYAGILILNYLACHSSTIFFYPHVTLVLEKLFIPLRDIDFRVRKAAFDLLGNCFQILLKLDKEAFAHNAMTKTLKEARLGLKSQYKAVEVIHGSLLACEVLFVNCGKFMAISYFETSEMILKFRDHKDALIRKTVINLISVLAKYDERKFSDHIFHRAMDYLLRQSEKPTERWVAFVAIGQVAVSVGSEMAKFLNPVMRRIKYELQHRGKKHTMSDEPIFKCIELLAVAVGSKLTNYIRDLLELLSESEMTEAFVAAMVAITRHIHPLRRDIQIRLLDLISVTLSGQMYKLPGAPLRYSRPDVQNSSNLVHKIHDRKSPKEIGLALDTIRTFNFDGFVLNELVRRCALRYLEDDDAQVRSAAVFTVIDSFARDPISLQDDVQSIGIVSGVIHKLLVVGVADPDPLIRQTVLMNLGERFDKHLSQTENMRALFLTINDEVFDIRIAAVKVLGRLAHQNPAPIMPSLRKALIQMMAELHLSNSMQTREECSQLLKAVIQNTRKLIKPYAVAMFVPLLDRAAGPNTTIAANIMDCIGELSVVAAEDAMAYIPSLMKIIIAQLSEPVPAKRNAALRALGQMCSSTGYVIDPLVDYPELLHTLHRIMRSESSGAVRQDVLRVLGILGAMDPYRQQSMLEEASTKATATSATAPPSSTSSHDSYFQTVVIKTLLESLDDPSLHHIHHAVIKSIMILFRSLGMDCVSYLPQVFPAFTEGTKTARYKEYYLSSLTELIDIVKEHVRNYVPQVCALVSSLWNTASVHQQLISVVEALGKALDAEFKPYMGEILPYILQVFDDEATSEKKSNAQMKAFDALLTFGMNLEEYLHLIIPPIVKAFERQGTIAVRKRAVQTLEGLTRRVNLADHASRIIHPLIRTLSTTTNSELRQVAMDLLCVLVVQAQDDFVVFIPSINKVLKNCSISIAKYEGLVRRLLNGEQLTQDSTVVDLWRSDIISAPNASAPQKLMINQQQLKMSWNLSNVSTEEDWNRWLSQLAQELIRQSPSHALRACTTVVSEHPPIALALFNAAFLSCWSKLYENYQDDLATSIESALSSSSASKELALKLLNLAEFMSRCGDPVLGDKAIGQYAMNLKAYAKALHYKELGYFSEATPSISLIEDLVHINTRLQQHDAAFGLITIAQERGISQHEEWFERLHKWKFALSEYEKRIRENPHQPKIIMGMIRCLHALGEWDRLAECVEGYWEEATVEEQRVMAGMGAASAWSLSDWESMEEYISVMPDDAPYGPFYKAILAVHNDDFDQANRDIGSARDLLAQEFTAGVEESRSRTYNVMIRAQMLSELEEIMQYKEYADQPWRQASMKRTWMKRLHGCQREVEYWQRILQVRSLVLSPGEDTAAWIKFANICRKSDRIMLAEKAIGSLIDLTNDRDKFETPPSVIYAQLKFMWARVGVPEKEMVLAHLRKFTGDLKRDLQSESNAIVNDKRDETQKLLARCHFKQGEWQRDLQDNWSLDAARGVLQSLELATQYDKTWYKAWHTWALMNFEVAEQLTGEERRFAPLHVRQAIKGFYWSISLHKESALQDVLRLLTLWFKYGTVDEISHVVAEGFSQVDIDTWLDVIPQIIARIQTPSFRIRQNIKLLLNEIGRHHPQSLVYPLSVASMSSSESRKKIALDLMDEMKGHSISIVEQALLVGRELIRVAMLWYDQWFEGLEEASRIYKIANDPKGMIVHLDRLHDMVEKEPLFPDKRTPQEEMFIQTFGQDLREARKYGNRFRAHGDIKDMEKAYRVYVKIYDTLALLRNNTTSLDLQYVSPKLSDAKNLELAVPGTYSSGKDIVYITNFTNKLSVFISKQRPRRMSIKGSDGVDYQFLLKGHEDLRQDERAMQLFSLVNTLLAADVPSHKRRLQIRQYPVVPIGPNVGLVGIVEESDTLNELIRDYRASRNIRREIEYNLMLRMAPDYERLPPMQKVEVFEYALENTTGKDIDRSLWDKSASSEHWLERRTTYTRSLALGSMVGHILGLGDRHPGNIMLERTTGKVVHIDFGDCFEVAMLRKEFPEKVPFRLTRMLRRAMEVSGVEGTFRNTCEISMRVLRENRESLMAVLEAFVYDPLINWRLEVDNYRVEVLTNGLDTNIQPDQFIRDAAGDPQGPNRRMRTNENDIFNDDLRTPRETEQEVRNQRALAAINRVKLKLSGRDFEPDEELTVEQQVKKLIQQATSLENLCQHFPGWCAYW